MKSSHRKIIVLAACLASPLAQAHDNSLGTGLLAGLAHPLTGLDHLVALVLCGLLFARLARGRYLALGGLAGVLGLGAVGGLSLGALAGMETLVLLSLPVLAVLQWRGRPAVALAVAGLFMAAHGWMHGVETRGMTQAFLAGFLVSSVACAGLATLLGVTLRARFASSRDATRSGLA